LGEEAWVVGGWVAGEQNKKEEWFVAKKQDQKGKRIKVQSFERRKKIFF